ISVTNEQLFLPLGLSINVENYDFKVHQDEIYEWILASPVGYNYRHKFIYGQVDHVGSSIEYQDPSKPWLSGVRDTDGSYVSNWIRSGVQAVGPWTDDA